MRYRGMIIWLGLLAVSAPSLVQAAPLLSVPVVSVSVGDTVIIPISIVDVTELTSWQFDLGFVPAIVQGNSVTEGPFMSAFGFTLFGSGVIDNTNGLVSLITNAFIDFGPSPTGTGILAEIEFLALAPGVSPLVLSNVFVNLVDQGFDIANGQITVTDTPPPVPEPAVLTLLAGGMVVCARRFGARRASRF